MAAVASTSKKNGAKKRGTSKWVAVRSSGIHNKGLFAIRDIPEDTKIIEYIGEKIIKAESERRANLQDERGRETGEGTVYMFTLNDRYDIDGNVSYNAARYANHSCDPNAHTDVKKGRVWLYASRDIKKGEEILYDYGFELDSWEDYPCLCGSKRCVGYIVAEEYRPKLKRKLKAKTKTKAGRSRTKSG